MVSLLIVVVVTAIVFDYINGFHDAANAIATVVSTGVLPIRTAVMIAGVFNFVGAITGTAVAKTIASGFAEGAKGCPKTSGTIKAIREAARPAAIEVRNSTCGTMRS